MYSDYLIRERQKGFAYASNPNLVVLSSSDHAVFNDYPAHHELHLQNGSWHCDCATFERIASCFKSAPFCAHVIAVEKTIEKSLDQPELFS